MTARKTPKDTQAQADQAAAQVEAQAALAAAQEQVLATVHQFPGTGRPLSDEDQAAQDAEHAADSQESEEDRAARHQAQDVRHADQEAQVAAEQALTGPKPVRATWRQHGQPLSGWEFFGTSVKTPLAKGIKVAKVEVNPQGITLSTRGSRTIEGGAFGSATKFWAVVPAEAPRKVEEPKAPKQERTVAEGRTSAAERLAAALAGDQAHAPAPEGYEIRWPKGGYDLLKRTTAPKDSPAWLVRCNTHNLTTPSEGGKAGDALGTKAGRLEWCSGCQADAKAEARAEARAKVKAETEEAQAAKVKAQAEAAKAKAEAAQEATAEHDSAVKSEG